MLHVGGRAYGGGEPLFGDWWVHIAPASRLYDFVIDARLYDKHGLWKIVIPQDRNGWGWRKLTGGPWTFRLRY